MEDNELYQGSIWDLLYEKKVITKPIKLIELFSGIGAQAKALEIVGISFFHHKTCEWAYNSIIGYNAIHIKDNTDYSKNMTREQLLNILNGNISINYNEPADLTKRNTVWLRNCYNNVIATHNMMSIMNVKGEDLDFNYEDTDKYEFLMTYSFPCQDLSSAGKKAGMAVSQANGGTRSGLLWEVERILTERFNQKLPLPNILIMENVPEVIGSGNEEHFYKWCNRLEELGYKNYHKIINAKDFGIPQNRNRCFMVSILGEYTYDFPLKIELKYKLKNILEKKVDEKYYLSKKMIKCFMSDGTGKFPRRERFLANINRKNQEIGNAITTLAGNRATDNFVVDDDNYVGTYQYAKSESFMNGKDRFQPDKELSDCIQTSQKEGVVEKYGREAINETIENNEIKEGTFIDVYNRSVNQNESGTITTRISGSNNYYVAEESEPNTLKEELCDTLIGEGLVQEGDIIKHSYTNQIMSGNKKVVEKSDEMITLTTRGDCVGVCVKDESVWSESQIKMVTDDGNIKRYIDSEQVDKFEEGQAAYLNYPKGYGHGKRTSNECFTICASSNGAIAVKNNLRIRKLTPCECMKLMGFERKDYESLVEYGLSDSAIYHCAGDSIVTTVIMGLIGTMIDKDYRTIIDDFAKGLTENER